MAKHVGMDGQQIGRGDTVEYPPESFAYLGGFRFGRVTSEVGPYLTVEFENGQIDICDASRVTKVVT